MTWFQQESNLPVQPRLVREGLDLFVGDGIVDACVDIVLKRRGTFSMSK